MVKNKKVKTSKKVKSNKIIIGIIALLLIILGAIYIIDNKKPKLILDNIIKFPKEEVIEKKVEIVDIDSKTRPYAVMINNIGAARPLQSGLQDAYIIYEIIVEGGLTRYLALFSDVDVKRIGSIRSARHYFLDYALENDAIYVHHGQSPQAKTDFSKLGIDRIAVDSSKTGWRDRTLKVSSEHTLFTSTENLAKGVGSKRSEKNKDFLLKYSVDALDLNKVENSKVANNVIVQYSGSVTSSYTYDSENKVYNRSVNNKEHKDYITGKQYSFKNILVYQVPNYSIGDKSGRQNIDNIGSGTGYYISEGIAVPISWTKQSRSSKTIYKYENGEELVVNDGNTFIQIQPKNKTLTIN
ncbi:MAG: DUF3048 domain-containing protein [Bacilli bacterium]|nr:DUF3048 domain-containing protein [Bacilli bacterium]